MARPLTSPGTITIIWLGIWLTALVLTHIPIEPGGTTRIPHLDKVAHVSLFFAIAYLGGLRLRLLTRTASARTLVFWAIIYLGYGALDELTQPITGRHSDLDDWLFDALGVALATIVLWKDCIPARMRHPEAGRASRM